MSNEGGSKWPTKEKGKGHRARGEPRPGGLRLNESAQARTQKINERLRKLEELKLVPGQRFTFGKHTYVFESRDVITGLVHCWRFNANNVRIIRDIDPRGIGEVFPLPPLEH